MNLLVLAAALAHSSALEGYRLPPPPATVAGIMHREHGDHEQRLLNAGLSSAEAREVLEALDFIKENYWGRIDEDAAVEQAIIRIGMNMGRGDRKLAALRGLAHVDGYSGYMTGAEYQAYQDRNRLNTDADYGLWFGRREAGRPFLVASVMKGSPADGQVRVGDEITAVDGVELDRLTRQQLYALYMPGINQRITLTIRRYPAQFDVTLQAVELTPRTVYSRPLTPTAGYVQISTFHGDVVKELTSALESLASKGMRSLVIDLRGNPGGSGDNVVACLNLFMRAGTVLARFEQRGKSWNETTRVDGPYNWLPIAVLVDGHSASAAEIFAGAVQDNNRGRIIGAKTFGKGIGQDTLPFKDGAIKLTTAWWLRKDGSNITGKGITPDTPVALSEADEEAVENRLHRQIYDRADPDYKTFDPVIMAAFRP